MVPSVNDVDVLRKTCEKCGGKFVVCEIAKEGEVVATKLKCEHCDTCITDIKMPTEDFVRMGGNYISDADVCRPLAELVKPDAGLVDARDMGRYADVFFALEHTVLLLWKSDQRLRDSDVNEAFRSLRNDFDNSEEGSVADELARSVKAMLISRRMKRKGEYTRGEIISCVKLLEGIAKEHENSQGDGYLRWVKTFFEGKLPATQKEIADYITKNET